MIAIKKRGEDIYDLSDLTILDSPPDHYWADPFLIENDGKTYLFFEDYDYEKGKIAVCEIVEEDGKISCKDPRVILNEVYHMSFPSVIKVDNSFYMTPERCIAGCLYVYKAERFPDVWSQHALVASGRFDDPIIRRIEGGFEIWTTQENKLVVFRSGVLHSDKWEVVRREDKPFMRSAGHFLSENVRPTQDCVPTYGRAIKILLGDNPTRSVEPTWYPNLTGTHTLNVSSKYVVVDGRIKIEQ